MNGPVLWGYRIPAKQVVGGTSALAAGRDGALVHAQNALLRRRGSGPEIHARRSIGHPCDPERVLLGRVCDQRAVEKIIPAEERNLLRPAVFLAFTILLIV